MAARIITVAQQKGGAGKTTLVAHLAVAWAGAGKRVAAVDIDPQQSLTSWYKLRTELLGEEAALGGRLVVRTITGWRAAAASSSCRAKARRCSARGEKSRK